MMSINKQAFYIAVALILCAAYVQADPIVGAPEDEKPADDTVKKVIKSVQDEIRKRHPQDIESIKPISYRTQVVSGMNYFIKALITDKNGRESYAHLRVWQKFTGQHELTALKTDVQKSSKLEYFQ